MLKVFLLVTGHWSKGALLRQVTNTNPNSNSTLTKLLHLSC